MELMDVADADPEASAVAVRPVRARHVVRALSASLAVALTLAGCSLSSGTGSADPVASSSPLGEVTTPELQPFYSQVLSWVPCEDGFQCATASAPMDWSDPASASIELALIRSEASGDALGSLLVNPGGPGASGYDFVAASLDYAVSSDLQKSYDIVGFDPRGVGRSSAVSCYDDPAELTDYIFGIPDQAFGSPGYITEIEDGAAQFGQDCLTHTGPLLGFVDTVSAARDLDLLRSVLGDEKLNYLGSSYGTLLGATYADLYPQNTGRLVLDGALDPTTSSFDVTATQAQGFESAFDAYLADCLTGDCPFDGTVEEAEADTRAILASLAASPLRASDGRMLGSATMFTAIILPLYSAESWPYLTQLFDSVKAGDADFAFQLADNYYSRNPDGTYSDNSTEAFIAVNCLDYPTETTTEELAGEAARLAELAPTFGPAMSYGGTSCARWPFPATRVRAPIAAAGSAPIVVVGTTNDPATPYVWAQALAAQLENGHLVTYRGEGHTAYNKSNACVDDAVDSFFLEGTVPAVDPQC
jgi:pimeloyl-ACP methyl ester carboxylesterase